MKRKCRGLELTSSGHADRRASGHAPFGARAVVHRLVKGTLHSRGLVAGRYQPLADGDTLIRVARPCLAFCSRIRKRSETNSNCCELRFASISDRSYLPYVIPSAARNLLTFFVIPSRAR